MLLDRRLAVNEPMVPPASAGRIFGAYLDGDVEIADDLGRASHLLENPARKYSEYSRQYLRSGEEWESLRNCKHPSNTRAHTIKVVLSGFARATVSVMLTSVDNGGQVPCFSAELQKARQS